MDELSSLLDSFCDEERFGIILRAKGIVAGVDGNWLHFDYTPGDVDVRYGSAGIIGRICVIGSDIKENELGLAFRI